MVKKPNSYCYEISLKNLGIINIGKSIHDGCLKKKGIMLDIQDLFYKKKNKYLSIIFERK